MGWSVCRKMCPRRDENSRLMPWVSVTLDRESFSHGDRAISWTCCLRSLRPLRPQLSTRVRGTCQKRENCIRERGLRDRHMKGDHSGGKTEGTWGRTPKQQDEVEDYLEAEERVAFL